MLFASFLEKLALKTNNLNFNSVINPGRTSLGLGWIFEVTQVKLDGDLGRFSRQQVVPIVGSTDDIYILTIAKLVAWQIWKKSPRLVGLNFIFLIFVLLHGCEDIFFVMLYYSSHS